MKLNAATNKDFAFNDEKYWMSCVIILELCIFFDFIIIIITCKIGNSLSGPIRLHVSLTQLLCESLSKSTMLRELGTNADYKRIQSENVIFN